MRQSEWLQRFQYFVIIYVANFEIFIRVECAEYRTLDVVSDGGLRRKTFADKPSDQDGSSSGGNRLSPRTRSLDNRFWTNSRSNFSEYPKEPERVYTTLSTDNGEYVNYSDDVSNRHTYVPVDRIDKEDLPSKGKSHLFKKFVIQPVIQYVVRYDKSALESGGEGEEEQTKYNKNHHERYKDLDRIRRGHRQKVDRVFNDIDAKFESYWDNDENVDDAYQNNGEGYSKDDDSDRYKNGGEGDYDFGEDDGRYSTTGQVYQPPEANIYVSNGGYRETAGRLVPTNNNAGAGEMILPNALHVNSQSFQIQQNQQQVPAQKYEPHGVISVVGGSGNGNNINSGSGQMLNMGITTGQSNSQQGSTVPINMGTVPSPDSMYGVPGMSPNQQIITSQQRVTPVVVGGNTIGQSNNPPQQPVMPMYVWNAMGQSTSAPLQPSISMPMSVRNNGIGQFITAPQQPTLQRGMQITIGQGQPVMLSNAVNQGNMAMVSAPLSTGTFSGSGGIMVGGELGTNVNGRSQQMGGTFKPALSGPPIRVQSAAAGHMAGQMHPNRELFQTKVMGVDGVSNMAHLISVGGSVAGLGTSSLEVSVPGSSFLYVPHTVLKSSSPLSSPPKSTEPQGTSDGGTSAEDQKPRRDHEKKPGGGGRGKFRGSGTGGRGGRNFLSALPKLPSSIGGHLSFIFTTRFGKGRRRARGGSSNDDGATNAKPSGSEAAPVDPEQPPQSAYSRRRSRRPLRDRGH